MKSLRIFVRAWLALTITAMAALTAQAQLTIDITTSAGKQIPVAIVPFGNEDTVQSITPIVSADLSRTGLFKLVPTTGISPPPTEPSEINFPDWASRSAEALVIGSLRPAPGGQVEVRFRLFDVSRQMQLASFSYVVQPAQLRATAHKIADEIYEKLTGDKGVFSTRIAYVIKRGARYELQVADADGANAQTVLASGQSIISPKWSPDGTRLAYVSFESQKATVVVQNLSTGERRTVANFFGNNSAPAWSPDGKSLAVTLTKDGTSQIYVIPATGGNPRRLTESAAIDTEADWSPDGSFIAFISDRSGGPQIYRVPVAGGQPQRLTFEGNYNVTPRVSPDSRSIAYVQREDGKFRIALLDIASGQSTVLSDGALDESPSFAPNGRVVLYESTSGGRGSLAAVSSDGRVKQRLTSASGDVRDPAWGPFVK
jgi:TolB protein